MAQERPDRALAELVARFGQANGETVLLRPEITASWRRCLIDGLTAERFTVPYRADIDAAGRLTWAAGPAFDRATDDLQGTPIALLLTDQHGHVLSRHEGTRGVANLMDHIDLAPGFVYSEELVGTNAIGTALEARGPSVIVGHEHFMDALTTISCAATPISDPTTGRIIGIVDLSCAAEYTTPLMLPLAKRVAWEIQQRLLGDESVDQHMLREQFLKARRSVRGPLFAISAAGLVVTGAAAALVDPADHDLIWELVGHSLAGGSSGWSHVSLGSGRTVALQCEPVMDGTRLVGAMVRVDDGCLTTGSSAIDDPWSTLTATEQAVADQVAQGLTNAEIADHLVLSPHTIDYHLRQLFRKLSLHSRVELTRAVVERRREP